MSASSASPETLVVHVIKTWLSSSHQRIESFWVGAQWEKWARYELFMALEEALGSQCLVVHSMSDFFEDSDEELDILIEPRENDQAVIAIKLRCEKVNENEGSYERFRDQMDADMTKIQGLGGVQSGFEGAKLLLVGFGGEPSAEDADFRTQSQPEHLVEGEVHCWIMKKEYPLET
ncbi:hypothetical protein PFICI_07087 [Pestalotiopsis fici W106-1]|uniref:Uncharacterized protein n=1 Tax=Pestalotiopsis fici (strain W106-1 / CGMCC3.15140) TaxID=1229662 RepID=W3X7Q6_PESFW|nr:uncharacterized protein PFICI_07087 [Pestalotiopsis fici W106-1]ETS82085.1 hypothetical protein PFICI_07087 [Pestalotiopsis fici W106-1]